MNQHNNSTSDKEEDLIHEMLDEHDFWLKKAPEGEYSLMKALSTSLYFTSVHYLRLQKQIISFLLDNQKMLFKFEQFRNFSMLQAFLQNPSLPEFEQVNLELAARMLKRQIKLYYMTEISLCSNLFYHKTSKSIKILRVRDNHYESLFPKSFRESAKVSQTVVLDLIDRCTGVESKQSGQIKFVNFEYENWLHASDNLQSSSTKNARQNLILKTHDTNSSTEADKNPSDNQNVGSFILNILNKRKVQKNDRLNAPDFSKLYADVLANMRNQVYEDGVLINKTKFKEKYPQIDKVYTLLSSFQLIDDSHTDKLLKADDSFDNATNEMGFNQPNNPFDLEPEEKGEVAFSNLGETHSIVKKLSFGEDAHNNLSAILQIDRMNSRHFKEDLPVMSMTEIRDEEPKLEPTQSTSKKLNLKEKMRKKMIENKIPSFSGFDGNILINPSPPVIDELGFANVDTVPLINRVLDFQSEKKQLQAPKGDNNKPDENGEMNDVFDNERHDGRLKFFDDKNNYGFLTTLINGVWEDVFVYGTEFQKANINIPLLRASKMSSAFSFKFNIVFYMGKYKKSKKAINLELVYPQVI
jgi:hypothetical protein